MTIPGPGRPYDVARCYADDRAVAGVPLRRWRGEWYEHRDTWWARLEESDLRTAVVRWLADQRVRVLVDEQWREEAWPVKGRSVADVVGMLEVVCHRASEADYTPGLFLSDVYLNADMEPRDYSLNVWNTSAADYAWDVKAECPVTLAWLNEILSPGDVQMLRQWFGYLVSGRTDLQKLLMMIGPPRSGKGTLLWLMENLLGPGSAASISTFGELTKTFGLQSLIGARLCVMPDVRWSTRDAADAVPVVLSIAASDLLDVNRKNLPAWRGRLGARLVIGSNDAPSLPDASGALAGRMLTITMGTSYLGREDPQLKEKLRPELPGLLRWALEGLRDLEEKGAFTESDTSTAARETTREAGNPTLLFVEDECTLEPHACVRLDTLYELYVAWCKRSGCGPLPKHVLSRQLCNTFRGKVSSDRLRNPHAGGVRQRWIRGLTVNADPRYSQDPVATLWEPGASVPVEGRPGSVPDGVPDE